jgi:type IV pilus assembly protein PilY1
MTTLGHNIRKFGIAGFVTVALACLGQTSSWSAPLTLPDSPLFALNTVEPNVILTLDDSGSMAWAYLPDSISVDEDTRRFCSSTFNSMYYDPTIVYSPGVDGTGAALPDSSFTGARINPYNPADANVVNLSTSYRPVRAVDNLNTDVPFNASYADCNTAPLDTPQPAFYYRYDSSLPGCSPQTTTTESNDACYTKVTVSATSGPSGTDERTNFANWYTYYRVRMLATKSAAGRAFAQLGENMRLAYQRIDSCTTLGVAGTGTCPGSYVRKFTAGARTDFFTWLIGSPMNGTTPLVQGAERVRTHLQATNVYSPWAENPGTSIGTEHSCRQNFSIIMTDGVWNGAAVGANVDNAAYTLPDGTAYNPATLPANRRIYPDANTGFLADVVFNTWRTDARGLTNNVPTYTPDNTGSAAEIYFNPVNDPANWQHAVTFTMGLGLDGLLDFPGDYTALLNGTKNWNGANHVDDLWHAAVNGRGQYYSARNPQQIVDSFTQTLNQIQARIGSGAGLSANGGSVSSDRYIYQVMFNTSNWTGRLLALTIDSVTGVPATAPDWDAAVELNNQDWSTGRNIFTYKPSTGDGARFRWTDLDAAQQDALNRDSSNTLDGNGAARLEYLRGASTNEGAGLNFRTRTCTDINGLVTSCQANNGKLGDIIISSAVFVGKPSFDYPETIESVSYLSFANGKANRTPMVYVGANDGMLHGFNATFPKTAGITGREEMAYVPNLVYSNISTNNLSLLSWQSYTHRYYVDGTPTAGDVFFRGDNAWHTVLVGGLRKGGKGYYALDITNPGTGFTEDATNAAKLVLWEFTDPDLGFSYSQAVIVKVPDINGTGSAAGKKGRWVAVFGNGYNNTGSGHAVLYVVDIENGSLIAKIDTAVSGGGGTAATPNGLATPAVVDVEQDGVADYVYAGDLQGKMWRFDLRSSTPSDWVAAANINAIFTARDSSGAVQPITTRPKVSAHPLGFDGLAVFFGTGKYLEAGDNTTTGTVQTQTFYGIYDRGATSYSTVASVPFSIGRADLLPQTISAGVAVGSFNTRLITDNAINWRMSQTAAAGTHLGWYVDLPTNGEKQVTDSVLREGRIVFTTLIPSVDPCTPGGTGWLMELDSNNGGRLEDTFDLNNDHAITSADRPGGTAAAGAQPSGDQGAMSTPVILTNPPSGGTNTETKISSTTTGKRVTMGESRATGGRQIWRQLK